MVGVLKYLIYPGSVTLYNGTVKTWNATDLMAAYNVADHQCIVVNTPADEPKGLDMLNYIPLKPRADDMYQDHPYVAEDKGEVPAYRPNFDHKKKYTMESRTDYVEEDIQADRDSDPDDPYND